MPGENRTDPLADLQGGVRVTLVMGHQMQEPKTAGQKADPLKIGPAIPDVVVVPCISAGHVIEPRHPAVQLHVVANRVSPVA